MSCILIWIIAFILLLLFLLSIHRCIWIIPIWFIISMFNYVKIFILIYNWFRVIIYFILLSQIWIIVIILLFITLLRVCGLLYPCLLLCYLFLCFLFIIILILFIFLSFCICLFWSLLFCFCVVLRRSWFFELIILFGFIEKFNGNLLKLLKKHWIIWKVFIFFRISFLHSLSFLICSFIILWLFPIH